jgi:hypothetical protein
MRFAVPSKKDKNPPKIEKVAGKEPVTTKDVPG